MVTAYLALGSNLGDREAMLRGAREALNNSPRVRVEASSPLYETDPVGGPSQQPPYLNAVLQVVTDLPAEALLRRCLEVEDRFGRLRQERWGARTLDVDVLFYGRKICRRPDLVLPHPRLHHRRFVLAPLADLAPELVHPVLGLTVCDLLARLPDGDGVHRILETW